MNREIHGMCQVNIEDADPKTGKPYLRLTFGDVVVNITTNLGEMIGGAATGARKRWEDQQAASRN